MRFSDAVLFSLLKTNVHILYRCLAHIINLATQALISTYSKSKFYNPEEPDQDLISESTAMRLRDEVGLIRTIAVKVRLNKLSSY